MTEEDVKIGRSLRRVALCQDLRKAVDEEDWELARWVCRELKFLDKLIKEREASIEFVRKIFT